MISLFAKLMSGFFTQLKRMSGFQAIFSEKLFHVPPKTPPFFFTAMAKPPVSGPLDRAPVSMADTRHEAAPTGPSNLEVKRKAADKAFSTVKSELQLHQETLAAVSGFREERYAAFEGCMEEEEKARQDLVDAAALVAEFPEKARGSRVYGRAVARKRRAKEILASANSATKAARALRTEANKRHADAKERVRTLTRRAKEAEAELRKYVLVGASTETCPGCGHFNTRKNGKHKVNGVEVQQYECLCYKYHHNCVTCPVCKENPISETLNRQQLLACQCELCRYVSRSSLTSHISCMRASATLPNSVSPSLALT